MRPALHRPPPPLPLPTRSDDVLGEGGARVRGGSGGGTARCAWTSDWIAEGQGGPERKWGSGACPPLWTRGAESERGRAACRRRARGPFRDSRARVRFPESPRAAAAAGAELREGGSRLL
ncbi:hypothetical protein STEG23_034798, partial [Scotinomys teguina]